MTIDFSSPLVEASDETLRAAIAEASIPTLMLSMIHMSGDSSLLEGPIKPLGVYINEFQGYMAEEDKSAVREQAFEVIRAYRDGGTPRCPPPSPDTVHKMMGFMVAQDVPAEYVPMMLEELELDGVDQRNDDWGDEIPSANRDNFPVLVIGGGMSGVLAAIRLHEAGIPFQVIEKNDAVGGTWYENRYPGARVDVANHLYCYSFQDAHHWTQYFAQQPELQAYFEGCVETFNLRSNFRFNTEVTAATWNESSQLWEVCVRNTLGEIETLSARAVISAVGQLNRPNIPDIPGHNSFTGQACHTAQWDPAIDVKGKRVVVIGSGASAFQLVPEVAKTAAQVTVFQRSAPWMFENPIYHEQVPLGKKWCLENLPGYSRWFRFLIFWPAIDGAWETVVVDPEWPHQDRSVGEANDFVRQMFTDYIHDQVGDDEQLLAKVIPDYAPMGKRTLQDNGSWLKALKQDNVELVNEAVTGISETGVGTESGYSAEADIIVFATGFKASQFLWPMDIKGREGQSLAQQWGQEGSANLGITVPNFPNFFLMYGPGTNLAFGGSLIFNGECQMRYIMECIKHLLQSGASTLECTQEAHDEYQQRFRDQHAKMIWEHGSIKHSFYQNAQGKCTVLWPWKILDMWQQTKSIDPASYHLN
ncbi:MAG: NAD(P)/FAD-dependent oxidoreductase [Halioglobus sp.]